MVKKILTMVLVLSLIGIVVPVYAASVSLGVESDFTKKPPESP